MHLRTCLLSLFLVNFLAIFGKFGCRPNWVQHFSRHFGYAICYSLIYRLIFCLLAVTTDALFFIFFVLFGSKLDHLFVICEVLKRLLVIEFDYVTCVDRQKLQAQKPQLAFHGATHPTLEKSIAIVKAEFFWLLLVEENVLSFGTISIFSFSE